MVLPNALARPEAHERFQIALHALTFNNKSFTARTFGTTRQRVRRCQARYDQYQKTGDWLAFCNAPRGDPGRTPAGIEDLLVQWYLGMDKQVTCPYLARQLAKEGKAKLSRQTVYNILCRRGVWESYRHLGEVVKRFEKAAPHQLWQIDLIEAEETSIGKLYALVILDDHSRYLLALRFFLAKEAEDILEVLYQTFVAHGLPYAILSDHGSQFWSEQGPTLYQQALSRLGIVPKYAPRPQTKGKVEKLIQFIQRDCLNPIRHQLSSLEQLNAQADIWLEEYNQEHLHEGLGFKPPISHYNPSPVQVDEQALWFAFTREEQRKVRSDAKIRYANRLWAVPERYLGWTVRVYAFAGRMQIYAGRHNLLIAEHSWPS